MLCIRLITTTQVLLSFIFQTLQQRPINLCGFAHQMKIVFSCSVNRHRRNHRPCNPDVGPECRGPSTFWPIPHAVISCHVYRGLCPGQGRWSPVLHYIMTEEVIRQCGGEGWQSNGPHFTPLSPLPLCVSCGFSSMWVWQRRGVCVKLNQSERDGNDPVFCVCVCPS